MFVVSSTVALGLIAGVSLLIAGGTTVEIDLTFELGSFDGIWLILGLPVLTILILATVSPLSFLIHRQVGGRKSGDRQGETS